MITHYFIHPLTANQLLTKAAYEKGKAIIENGIFEHNFNNRYFSEWVSETGYKYLYAGENLAMDYITAEGTMRAWMTSPTHMKNIINPETGV